jgi:UDP-3-O-[3-hydroxymyristoyl] glucosamine N-acyltransferase
MLRFLVWTGFAPVAFAAPGDLDDDGCLDAAFAANGACIHPTATIDPLAIVGARATVGAEVSLAAGVVVAPRASLAGRTSGPNPRTIGAGTTIGRRAAVGTDATMGNGTSIAADVVIGPRFTAGSGAVVGFGVEIGPDVTLGTGATVGSLVDVGAFAEITGSVGRASSIAGAAGAGTRSQIHGDVGPNVIIGTDVTVEANATVRSGATLNDGVTVSSLGSVGRGAVLEAGATVGAGARVRAGGTVCAGDSLGAGDIVPPGETSQSGGCTSALNGSDNLHAAQTCKTLHASHPTLLNGYYWIDPDLGASAWTPVRVYCDMQHADGGGWTLVLRADSTSHAITRSAAAGGLTGTDGPQFTCTNAGDQKFSDAFIKAIWTVDARMTMANEPSGAAAYSTTNLAAMPSFSDRCGTSNALDWTYKSQTFLASYGNGHGYDCGWAAYIVSSGAEGPCLFLTHDGYKSHEKSGACGGFECGCGYGWVR